MNIIQTSPPNTTIHHQCNAITCVDSAHLGHAPHRHSKPHHLQFTTHKVFPEDNHIRPYLSSQTHHNNNSELPIQGVNAKGQKGHSHKLNIII